MIRVLGSRRMPGTRRVQPRVDQLLELDCKPQCLPLRGARFVMDKTARPIVILEARLAEGATPAAVPIREGSPVAGMCSSS